ncbi:4-hydroxy-tetrahydrodipicolinate synthase [Mastigocoleus sp. MO_188.B34]|uniref:4-hydroxy-tetrahydrodipicolinate synthase n=1 Tax=Mastigocoleus sp. MO_188.B34 TaxID=3036635 RepID=UPI0026221474|nr:4-hydroxy-tetrahydrodipicolinate synthase [Mastigocoleus sp. MO_188.B34]MDJ0696605.1 4-hydroxy-tetrahydrodipicolinate synthase [Mastigocoleus sp. MO_188.B34]
MVDFGKVLTAMVTPLNPDGSVNYDVAASLAKYLVENGTETVVVCGTTGESPTLNLDEEYQLFSTVLEAVAGKALVMAGCGSNSTKEAIVATQKAEKLGVHGTLQVVPYYNKPPQAGLYKHFQTISQASELPVLLYNIPGRTGCTLEVETVARLAEISNIVGIKESTGRTERVSEIRSLTPAEFQIYSGDDYMTLPLLAVGAKGIVSVASHLVGNELQQMIQAFNFGQVGVATEIHLRLFPLFKALFATSNPILIKEALRLQGWDVGFTRLPLYETNSKASETLAEVLQKLSLI